MLDRFTWFWQSAYLWRGDGINIYIDPRNVTVGDPADVIFITHAHDDHFLSDDIERIRTPETQIFAPHDVARELGGNVTPVAPGDSINFRGVTGEAVPAYNVVEGRLEKHPKRNNWVGYILTLGGRTYFHAGDTDHTPDHDSIRADVAFLPIGGTFTMDPSEAARLAKRISPQVAVPMHYGFIVGSPSDADRFAKEADPVRVEILKPENPFELE